MQNHPEINLKLANLRIDAALREVANDRRANEARRAAPDFIPSSRYRDPAFWSALVGPVVGLGFLAYFAQEIIRAAV
jgi:hypothetical protein